MRQQTGTFDSAPSHYNHIHVLIHDTYTHLGALASRDMPVPVLVVELEAVGVELQVFLLPRLHEGSAKLEHLALHDAVCRSDCTSKHTKQ